MMNRQVGDLPEFRAARALSRSIGNAEPAFLLGARMHRCAQDRGAPGCCGGKFLGQHGVLVGQLMPTPRDIGIGGDPGEIPAAFGFCTIVAIDGHDGPIAATLTRSGRSSEKILTAPYPKR